VLISIVTTMAITGRSTESVNNYFDNRVRVCAVLTVIVIITGRPICGVNSYCDNIDNNGEVYMQW